MNVVFVKIIFVSWHFEQQHKLFVLFEFYSTGLCFKFDSRSVGFTGIKHKWNQKVKNDKNPARLIIVMMIFDLGKNIKLPDSYLFDYNFNGVTHECPIFDKPIFDINIIAEVLRK